MVQHSKQITMQTLVIESVEKEFTEWGISFTDPNPEAKDYFKMPDAETSFRLKSYLENHPSPNIKGADESIIKQEVESYEHIFVNRTKYYKESDVLEIIANFKNKP